MTQTLTYAEVMSIVTDYLPDVSVIVADAFITALVEAQEDKNNVDLNANFSVAGFTKLIDQGADENTRQSYLANLATMFPVVMNAWTTEGHKIKAIKDLRFLTGAGLKDAKDALESHIVSEWVAKKTTFTTTSDNKDFS